MHVGILLEHGQPATWHAAGSGGTMLASLERPSPAGTRCSRDVAPCDEKAGEVCRQKGEMLGLLSQAKGRLLEGQDARAAWHAIYWHAPACACMPTHGRALPASLTQQACGVHGQRHARHRLVGGQSAHQESEHCKQGAQVVVQCSCALVRHAACTSMPFQRPCPSAAIPAAYRSQQLLSQHRLARRAPGSPARQGRRVLSMSTCMAAQVAWPGGFGRPGMRCHINAV